MREERKLTEWMADYRDSLDALAPPAAIEARLRAEVRRRRRVAVAPWLLAAGAAALLALGIWIGRSRPEERLAESVPVMRVPLMQVPVMQVPVMQVPVMQVPEGRPVVEREPLAAPEVAAMQPRRALPVPLRRAPVEAMNAGSAAVFVMLPGSELMPPAQDLQVLRVRIPRSRFQAMGWPVNVDRLDERILAEVMVGGDGVARAVRLVPAEQ